MTSTSLEAKIPERSLEEQIASLSPKEAQAFKELKTYWLSVQDEEDFKYNDFMILRFLRNSPGREKFNVVASKKVAHRYAKWAKKSGLRAVNISTIRAKLETGNFIITGGNNLVGNATLYVRANQHFPSTADMTVHSLVYTLSAMSEVSEATCTHGVNFLINMDGWGWSNFSPHMAKSLVDTVQGRFPCRLRHCVVYNAPRIFSMAWKVMRPLLSAELQDKIVYVSTLEELTRYYSIDNVPQCMGGTLDLDQCMQASFKQRYAVEGMNYEAPYPSEMEATEMIRRCTFEMSQHE